jgi:hypothetical protein
MPAVAGFVVRRRGHASVGQAPAPLRLAFELGAVARRAVLRVDLFAERHFGSIARIGPRIIRRRARIAAGGEQSEYERRRATDRKL